MARTSAPADGDIEMEEADADPEAEAEHQLEELKKCFEEFRPKIEGNAWCRTLLETL